MAQRALSCHVLCHRGCWAPLSQEGCAGSVDSSITACVGLVWLRALLCQGCNTVVPKWLCCAITPCQSGSQPLLHSWGLVLPIQVPQGQNSPPLALLISTWTLWDKLRPCPLSVPLSHPASTCTRGCDLPTPRPWVPWSTGTG